MKTTVKKLRIALCGGGTGGHIYPQIAVMQALSKRITDFNLEFHYFGRRDAFTADLLKQGADFHRLATGKARRYFSLWYLVDLPKIAWSFLEAFWKLFWLMPDAVFSKGGPGSVPVVFAAWFYRIPVLIHESDAAPGLGNLLSAPFARNIAVGFEDAAKYFNRKKVFVSGNPVRASILQWRSEQGSAKEKLGFLADKPLVLVIGGSQGAQSLNELVVLSLPQILPVAQIFHQTGTANYADVEKLSKAQLLDVPVDVEKTSRYKFIAYLDDETDGTALAAADLVVGRAGAGSVSEFAAFGKPAILVPLEGHQKENAYAFAATGAARVIEQENLEPPVLEAAIRSILQNPETLRRMSDVSAKFYKADAADVLAQVLVGFAE